MASEAEGSTPGAPPRTWSAAVFNIEDGGWSWVGFRLCIIGLLDFEYLVSFLLLLWSDFSIKLTESLESWIRLRQSFLCDLLTNSQNYLFLLKTTRTILSGNSCHFVNLLIFANTFSFLSSVLILLNVLMVLFWNLLKVSRCQNKIVKPKLLPKNEPTNHT